MYSKKLVGALSPVNPTRRIHGSFSTYNNTSWLSCTQIHASFIIYHLSLNHEGHWGTTDDFTTSFLHFSLFSTALWDLANSRPVNSPMLSSHLFVCLPCFLPPFTVPCKMVLQPDLMNGRHVHTTAVCISWQWSGLHVVQLPAGSWHGLPRW